MDARAAPPQPNFETISDSFDALSQQFALCGNLPAVDGGARLVHMVQAVLNRLDALDRKVDGLDRKVTVSNRNAVARAQNSTVIRGNMELEPLYSMVTGERLDHFPQTLDQLERLQLPAVNDLLTHLGEAPRGRLEERRRQLKLVSGLVTRAV
ncbi:hypothetical protein GQ602_002479 [Ophiocordyceps camponoti-floridani]|uniref:Uncharacterized protein n=1 Tax=Ophiocordyceps camponoti-floridani TaxID=2030778 RepID=A0A8H4VFB5_9HYPO|nr:hypothetical protein GQ602_002479 [Ophiocordyceps camponoti-floridani]